MSSVEVVLQGVKDNYFKIVFGKYVKILESPNTDMLLRDLLLITHHYIQSNSKTS